METQHPIKLAGELWKILQMVRFAPDIEMLSLFLGAGQGGGCLGREAERQTDRQTEEESYRQGWKQMSTLSPSVGRQVPGSSQLPWLETSISWKTKILFQILARWCLPSIRCVSWAVTEPHKKPSSGLLMPPPSSHFLSCIKMDCFKMLKPWNNLITFHKLDTCLWNVILFLSKQGTTWVFSDFPTY